MLIQLKDATRIQIDYLVAKIEGFDYFRLDTGKWNTDCFNPSTNRDHGGAISERELISAGPTFTSGTKGKFICWEAYGHNLQYDEAGEYIEGSDHCQEGETELIAKMRCFISSRMGNEVEVLDELCIQSDASQNNLEPNPPPGYTAEELERDNPYNQWMRE